MTLEDVLPSGATELSVRRFLSPIFCELFCKTDQKNEGKESRLGKGGRVNLMHYGYLELHREGKEVGRLTVMCERQLFCCLLEILSCKRNEGFWQ